MLQCDCLDPDNKGENPCGEPDYKGDKNCDHANNNKACDWDGGDCCPKTVKGGKIDMEYCDSTSKKVGCAGLWRRVGFGFVPACVIDDV